MVFDNLMGYILSIPMCMQNFITIFHSVQEIGPFSLFQNLNLGKTSTNPKCHLTISLATSSQYQCVCKISSQHSSQFKRQGHFHFFRIWSSAKPRPIKKKKRKKKKGQFAISEARSCQYQCLRNSL